MDYGHTQTLFCVCKYIVGVLYVCVSIYYIVSLWTFAFTKETVCGPKIFGLNFSPLLSMLFIILVVAFFFIFLLSRS